MRTTSMATAPLSHVINHYVMSTFGKRANFGQTIRAGLQSVAQVYRTTNLMRIQYDASYSLEIEMFDSRRQTIINVYNALNDELGAFDGHHSCVPRLNENAEMLVRLIGKYFSFEESLMDDFSYPGHSSHKKEHIRFLESLDQEISRMQAGVADMYDLSYLIGSWLSKHMRGPDRMLGDFIGGALNGAVEVNQAA
ncbi:Bacteriohemerythrin [uncultured Gammaproteobacteria bacterium]